MIGIFLFKIKSFTKKSFFLILLGFVCAAATFNAIEAVGANQNKPFDLKVEQISSLRSDSITPTIRRTFDEFVKVKTEHPDWGLPHIMDGEKYLSLLSKKFMVLEFEGNDFGGFWATIAIDPKNPRYFYLWVYNIGSDQREEWDVRSIEELFLNPESKAQLEEIKSAKYQPFWL